VGHGVANIHLIQSALWVIVSVGKNPDYTRDSYEWSADDTFSRSSLGRASTYWVCLVAKRAMDANDWLS
jgi:hypothetical protein